MNGYSLNASYSWKVKDHVPILYFLNIPKDMNKDILKYIFLFANNNIKNYFNKGRI